MLTKPEIDRLERIATACLSGGIAGDLGYEIELKAKYAIRQAQELIKQLDALAEAE